MNVHLVGSIGLDTVDEVFATVGRLLGPHLRRIPDGEVGGRRQWISWQYPLLLSSPYLKRDPSGAIRPTNRFPLLTLADGVAPAEVKFGELGYAREARASYLDFIAAREAGMLPKNIRFQVCLPTPFAVVSSVVVPAALAAVEAAYEKAMIAEVAALVRHIPHKDLCIQWDVCNEMVIWDGQSSDAVPGNVSHDDIIARMKRLCAAVPDDVELGLHLCYGDFGAKHFVEPKDAAQHGRFRQCADQGDHTQARLYSYAGSDRSQRRRFSSPACAISSSATAPRCFSASCMPKTASQAPRRASPRRAATRRTSASPPNAVWHARAPKKPCARC